MSLRLLLPALLLLGLSAVGQENASSGSSVGEILIGARTYFDFGPPFSYYEILIVRPVAGGSKIQRIMLTPGADVCLRPATVETASASIAESADALLGDVHPCEIPEKKLRHEAKRCKKCSVFSGSETAMRFQCGAQTRVIRSSVFDRDWFDPAAKTPGYTSWSMRFVERLEKPLGPGVMDKPVFPTGEASLTGTLDPDTAADLIAGKFDELFPGADKPSAIYLAATAKDRIMPTATLRSSSPFEPESFVNPSYPPLAKAAHVQGSVSFQVEINGEGRAINPVLLTGHPLLKSAAIDAIKSLKFPTERANQQARLVFDFELHCPKAETAVN